MSKKLYINLTEEEYEQYESSRNQLGMKRGKFLKYLLNGQKEIRPTSIVNIRLVDKLSELDRHLKVIAVKDALSDNEKIYVMEQLRDIKELLDNLSRSSDYSQSTIEEWC